MSDSLRQSLTSRNAAREHSAAPELPIAAQIDRRQFMQLLAASTAVAGGCSVSQPKEEIVPYVRAPEYEVQGQAKYYATCITLSGYATGVLAESHMGRPTKLEGNPDHPASLGGLDAITQAAILSLYDPDRAQAVTSQGQIHSWEDATTTLETALTQQKAKQGAGLRVLTNSMTSPTITTQFIKLRETYPAMKWHQYEPLHQDHALDGAMLAFGRPVDVRYHFDQADVVLSLDADFLTFGPGHAAYARQFMNRRALPNAAEDNTLNRLYVLETNFTSTGVVADHRWALRPDQIVAAARYLTRALRGEAQRHGNVSLAMRGWLDVIASDLKKSGNRAVVIAGPWQPPLVHALAHAMNEALGSAGTTLDYLPPVLAEPQSQLETLRELVQDAAAGDVEVLLIAGGNPGYDAPADIPFADALANVPLTLRLGLYDDETSRYCQWHLPAAHELESWGDSRAFDGTASLQQPLIEPLYDGKTLSQLLSILLGEGDRSSREIVRDYWRVERGEDGFEDFWRKSLHDGVVADTSFEPITPTLDMEAVRSAAQEKVVTDSKEALSICLRPDPSLYDGRFANNAWLQELPRPLTKLTWDNAALISPQTAKQLRLSNEQLVDVTQSAGGKNTTLRVPIWILPGHAEGVLTVYLGHGRHRAGRVAYGNGVNVYPLRRAESPWLIENVQVTPLAERVLLATTQHHHRMEGRDLVRSAPWERFHTHPDFAQPHTHGTEETRLYPSNPTQLEEGEYAWGMSINLNACTGCNACVTACQAENNIPSVGKEQVRAGREMHWIRIDSYFEGDAENPTAVNQPVTCMHCESAPCEVVCPVAATVHSAEGLNEMVYNRCVGTRYCSNNCPYKVRRFNFLHYADDTSPLAELLHNPDVTVRSRGVMEKCTYCVQRISAARIDAKKQNRAIRDGEVITACQSACPSQAIVFGDTKNPESRVTHLKADPRNYGLLTELNTVPRTTYLARVTNPHPDLA